MNPADDRMERAIEAVHSLERTINRQTAAPDIEEAVKARLLSMRSPGKAQLIGQERSTTIGALSADSANAPAVKAWLDRTVYRGETYEPGALITAIANARSHDGEEQARGKAMLDVLGVAYNDQPVGKATLGATGATGGYTLPNNLVDSVVKPNVAEAMYTSGSDPLLTVRTGVAVRGVDLPFRPSAPSRMSFIDWGALKTNVDETYGSYTALLGTLAAVYDVGKQYLRFSAGAAEQDVMDELVKGAHLAENYYVIAGAGTGTSGVGDPTKGVYTQLTAAGMGGAYTTTFAGASNSTVAGSAAAGILTAIKAMATRSVRPTACVMDPTTYYQILTQGSDTAGFWLPNLLGAGFTQNPDGSYNFQGVRLLWDPNFDTNTSSTKRAILGNWQALKFYRGAEFRIDSTDVAGTRWDYNLVGFRGEEEIAVHAGPAVFTGNFQLITALIP